MCGQKDVVPLIFLSLIFLSVLSKTRAGSQLRFGSGWISLFAVSFAQLLADEFLNLIQLARRRLTSGTGA